MPQEPRDFAQWTKSVERRLQQALRAGQSPQAVRLARDIQRVREEIQDGTAGPGRRPAAPVELVIETRVLPDLTGAPQGEVSVSFTPVTVSVNAKPIEVDRYELWIRNITNWEPDGTGQDTGPEFLLSATSEKSSIAYSPVRPGGTYEVKVGAVAAGVPGPLSATRQVTIVRDTTPPPIPSALELSSSGATVTAAWDLLAGTGEPMPVDFSHTEVAYGYLPPPTEVVGTITNLFSQAIFETPPQPSDVDFDGTWYFRHRAVDTSGNKSAWSPTSSIVPKSLIDEAALRFELEEFNRERIGPLESSINDEVRKAQDAIQNFRDEWDENWDPEAISGLVERADGLEATLKSKAESSQLDQLNTLLAGRERVHTGEGEPDDTTAARGITYEWAGTPHASESIKYVDGVEVARNRIPNPSFEVDVPRPYNVAHETEQSAERSRVGNYSARAYDPDGGYNRLGGNWTVTQPAGFVVARVWVYIPSSNGSTANRGRFQWQVGTTAYFDDLVLDEWFQAEVSRDMPASDGSFWFGIETDGNAPGDEVWFDAVQIAVAPTEAEALAQVEQYFDGDTEDALDAPAAEGTIYYQTDGGEIVAIWRRSADDWVKLFIGDTAVPGLDSRIGAAKDRLDILNSETLPGLSGSLDNVKALTEGWTTPGTTEIDGGQISSNSVKAGSVDTEQLSSVIANIIELNVDRLTGGKLSADRIDVNDLAAQIATVIELSAERIATGKLGAERIDVNDLVAETAHLMAAQMQTLSVSDRAEFARAFADEIWSELGVFNRLDAREGWIGGVALQEGAVAAKHVDMEDFTASQGFIDNAFVNLIQGKMANFDQALIGGVLLEEGAVSARHLTIADTANLFPQQAVLDLAQYGDNQRPWVRPGGPSGTWTTIEGQGRGMTSIRINDGAIGSSRARIEYRPGGTGIKLGDGDSIRLTWYGWGGGTGTPPRVSFMLRDAAGGMIARLDGEDFQSGWNEYALEVHSTVPQDRYLVVEFNKPAGETMRGHMQDFRMRHMANGELIVDGAIKARNLDAQEIFFDSAVGNAIAAGSGRFLTIETGNLASNAVTADKISFGSLNGALITGLQIQTHTNNRGVKITSAGIRAFNTSGTETFTVDASNGSVTAVGGDFTGSTFTGGTFTGNTFSGGTFTGGTFTGGILQTHTGNRGVRIANGNIVSRDANGNTMFEARENGNAFFDGRVVAQSIALAGELRAGVGGTGEGGLVPVSGRVRLQGRMAADAGSARDTFMYGLSSLLGPSPVGNVIWDVVYPEPRPNGTSAPIVTTMQVGPDSVTSVSTFNESASGFSARATGVWLTAAANLNDHRFRIRYLTAWRQG